MSVFTIQLQQLRFFAPHGLFAEEGLAGNEFEVNVSMEIGAPDALPVALPDTIDYGKVFHIVQSIFGQKEGLLENIAMKIAAAIKAEFSLLKKIDVQVCKLQPPIAGFTGSVSVTYTNEYAS